MKRQDKIAIEQYKKKIEFARTAGEVNPFETKEDKLTRIERAKKDVRYMVDYYFPHYASSPCNDFHVEYANLVKKNPTIKIFCQWGRGLAKSVWNSIFIPYWLWLNGEKVYYVLIGNSEAKAKQLLDDLMAEWEANPRIINDFGKQQRNGTWESGFFITNGGFIGQALGMGQSVRGLRVKNQRPTLLNPDDISTKELVKNPKRQNEMVRWIERDLIPTMDGDIRRYCHSNNRFAPRMIQTILQEKHPKWHVHYIKAYNPVNYAPKWHEKYPKDYYRELIEGDEGIGVLAGLAEFNGEPHIEGEVFKESHIQWVKLPRLDYFDAIVGHWDVAYAGTPTSDYNAVRIWGLKGRNFYYIDSFVKQSKMRAAVEYIADMELSLPKSVVVMWQFEAQFWNDEVQRTIEEVEYDYGVDLRIAKIDNPRGKKYDRILTLHPYYQNGRIYYNIKKKSHNDTQVGLAQLFGIEPGYRTKDDAPDADDQAIKKLSKYIPRGRKGGANDFQIGKYEKRNIY